MSESVIDVKNGATMKSEIVRRRDGDGDGVGYSWYSGGPNELCFHVLSVNYSTAARRLAMVPSE